MGLRVFTVLMSCFLLFGFVQDSHAQDAAAVEGVQTEDAPDLSLATAQKKALSSKVKDVMHSLEKDELHHFMVIYANYSVYNMVSTVRGDVQKAADACAKNNPDMAEEITSRFSKWDETIGGGLKDARTNIDNLSLAQNYLPKADFEMLFSLVDSTRSATTSSFERIPVTTPEACTYMLSKMDETESSMKGALDQTLISYPNLLKATQE